MREDPGTSVLLGVLWLLLAFGVFMAIIWSVYAVNRATVRRYGYEPFSLPNAALMLIANLLLLSVLAPAEDMPSAHGALRNQAMLGGAAVLALGVLAIVARRSNLRYALYAVALMSVGAFAVLPSLVFMRIATAPSDSDVDARVQQSTGGVSAQGGDRAPPKHRPKP